MIQSGTQRFLETGVLAQVEPNHVLQLQREIVMSCFAHEGIQHKGVQSIVMFKNSFSTHRIAALHKM